MGSGQFCPSNRSTIILQLCFLLNTQLKIRDGRDRYRPANADQILEAARRMQRCESKTFISLGAERGNCRLAFATLAPGHVEKVLGQPKNKD